MFLALSLMENRKDRLPAPLLPWFSSLQDEFSHAKALQTSRHCALPPFRSRNWVLRVYNLKTTTQTLSSYNLESAKSLLTALFNIYFKISPSIASPNQGDMAIRERVWTYQNS